MFMIQLDPKRPGLFEIPNATWPLSNSIRHQAVRLFLNSEQLIHTFLPRVLRFELPESAVDNARWFFEC